MSYAPYFLSLFSFYRTRRPPYFDVSLLYSSGVNLVTRVVDNDLVAVKCLYFVVSN